MRERLVFHWRQAGAEQNWRANLVIALSLVALSLVALGALLPVDALAKVDWAGLWHKLQDGPLGLAQLAAYALVIAASVWTGFAHKQRARLVLDADTLRYTSGLPLLSRWLDWTLDLAAVRANKLAIQVAGQAMGAQPAQLYRLAWRGAFTGHALRPGAWYVPGKLRTAPARPTSVLGLVRWSTPENRALLQRQFDQLPLIEALRQRGVVLPPLSGKMQGAGLDLMAYPRMKVAVISFFVSLAAAFALFHGTRHQHYFTPPPVSWWFGFGGLASLLMLVWLRSEQTSKPAVAADRQGFRVTQVLLAALFGLSAGLCAPSVPLAWATVAQTPIEQTFTLQKSTPRLRAEPPGQTPDIHPTQALDYWASLPQGATITLPVRQGIGGLWQFDSSMLRDKLDTFYATGARH